MHYNGADRTGPMRRRLLNLLTFFSLLLFLVVVGLWVRGYATADELRWVKWPYTYALRSYLGGIQAARSRDGLFSASGYSRTTVSGDVGDPDGDGIAECPPYWSDRYNFPDRSWECCGFAAAEGRGIILVTGPLDPDIGRFAVAVVPCWFIVAATALLPGVRLSRVFRRVRRRYLGRCVACGYNLTGNVSGLCPECATRVSLLR